MSKKALQISLWPLDYMIEEAIGFLRENEPAEGYFVGFSGGKDSIVLEHLCRLAGVQYHVGYSFTGIDPPEVVKFIRKKYPNVVFYKPKMSFWKGIEKKMPPLKFRRWCCDVLKKDPTKHIKMSRALGMRMEESPKRASQPKIDYHKKYKQYIYKPIFEWTEWHLWSFIEKYKLSFPSLYDEGFHRLGCVVCPFLLRPNQGELKKHMIRWPKHYKRFEKAVYNWFYRNDRDKKESDLDTFEKYIEAYYRGFERNKRDQGRPGITSVDELF